MILEIGIIIVIYCIVSVIQGFFVLIVVYWLYNGKNLDILDSVKYFGGIMNFLLLIIKNIVFIDVGVYYCGVINFVGLIISLQLVILGR